MASPSLLMSWSRISVVPTGQLLQGSATHHLFSSQRPSCQAVPFSSPCSPVYLRRHVLMGHVALPAQTVCLLGPGTALLSQAGWGWEGGIRASPVCFSHWMPGQTSSNNKIHSRIEEHRPGCPENRSLNSWQAQTLAQGQDRRSNSKSSKKTGTLREDCSPHIPVIANDQRPYCKGPCEMSEKV